MKIKIGIPGLSFSLKRALGITRIKQKVSRKTGVPLTQSGLERKIGNYNTENVIWQYKEIRQ